MSGLNDIQLTTPDNCAVDFCYDLPVRIIERCEGVVYSIPDLNLQMNSGNEFDIVVKACKQGIHAGFETLMYQ